MFVLKLDTPQVDTYLFYHQHSQIQTAWTHCKALWVIDCTGQGVYHDVTYRDRADTFKSNKM